MSGKRDAAVFAPASGQQLTVDALRLECLRMALARLPYPADRAEVEAMADAFFAYARPRAAERMTDVPTVSP